MKKQTEEDLCCENRTEIILRLMIAECLPGAQYLR